MATRMSTARTVKKLNMRWERQRPIVRGGTDHDETPDEPDAGGGVATITSRTPASVAAGAGNTTITVVGDNFVPGATIRYTRDGTTATATSTYVSSIGYTFVLPASALVSAGTITWTFANPSADAISGPSIAVT